MSDVNQRHFVQYLDEVAPPAIDDDGDLNDGWWSNLFEESTGPNRMVSIITIDPDVHFDMRAHGAALLHLYHSHGFRLFTVLDERIQKLAFDRPATVINYNQLRNAIATPSTRKIYVQGFNFSRRRSTGQLVEYETYFLHAGALLSPDYRLWQLSGCRAPLSLDQVPNSFWDHISRQAGLASWSLRSYHIKSVSRAVAGRRSSIASAVTSSPLLPARSSSSIGQVVARSPFPHDNLSFPVPNRSISAMGFGSSVYGHGAKVNVTASTALARLPSLNRPRSIGKLCSDQEKPTKIHLADRRATLGSSTLKPAMVGRRSTGLTTVAAQTGVARSDGEGRCSSPVVDTKPSRAELYASGHISQYIPTIRVFDADSTVDPPMDPVQAAPGDNVDLKSETPEQPRPALTGSMRNTFNPKTLLGVELEGARGNIVTGSKHASHVSDEFSSTFPRQMLESQSVVAVETTELLIVSILPPGRCQTLLLEAIMRHGKRQ